MKLPTTLPTTLPTPGLKPFAHLLVQVDPIIDVGHTGNGQRRVVPITGGTCQTADWQARVLSGGADYQWLTSDRVSHLDARYVLETDAGDRIFVQNTAIRVAEPEVMARLMRGEAVAAAELYFRCVPSFETSVPALRWMMERLFIGTGARRAAEVELLVFEVL